MYNNGFNLGYDGASGLRLRSGAASTQVYNNTLYKNVGPCIEIDGPSNTNTIIRNNICFGNSNDTITDFGTGTVADHNLLGTDPLFVNAAAADFNLRAGSPAIGAGVAMPGLVYKGSAPDLGAFESGTGGQLPAPILRLVGN
jgi:hypothetical protein